MAETTGCQTTFGNRCNSAHITIPVENVGTTGMSMPYSSRALWTEKTDRKLVIAIQSDASAICRPPLASGFQWKTNGARIDTHQTRRPQPKPKGIVSLVRDPSS